MKTLLSICVSLLVGGTRLFAEEEKVLLKTTLPEFYINSSPFPIYSTNINLEPQPPKQWPEFYVPVGTTNLALHKPVTASCKATIGNLDMVTDGDKSGDDGSWLELEAGKQWVQIDLQRSSEIYAVVVWHWLQSDRPYKSVVVAVSDDAKFKQNVQIIFNNDIQNDHGLGKGRDYTYLERYFGKLIDAKGIKGRYVRLYSDGNAHNKMNHYVEVEVFGKELKPAK